jgi:hypothetical protein
MIIQLFGIMDFLAGILLITSRLGLAENFAFYVAMIVIIKALLMFTGVVSLMDLLGGLLLILSSSYGVIIFPFVFWVFVLWFLQKAFFSFVS